METGFSTIARKKIEKVEKKSCFPAKILCKPSPR